MKIILSGGGTIGSVAPLLALLEELPHEEFIFIGTKKGPERELLAKYNIKYLAIASGKLRRYLSFLNLIDLVRIKIAFFQSIFLLIKERPDIIVSVGSFASVPLVLAGWLLRIPSIIHSQDIKTGLAIKLMNPFAKRKTKAFADTDFQGQWIGNPVRDMFVRTNKINLSDDKPVILIIGGSTGALGLNKLVNKELCDFCQVIHLTGKRRVASFEHKDYHDFSFLKEELFEAYQKADLVVTRAGLSTLSELAFLGKPCLIIPMPDSHQEVNAQYFADHKAGLLVKQHDLSPEKFNKIIKLLLENKKIINSFSENIKKINKPHAAQELAKIIQQFKRSA
jgi:UDP-N-acetylglucosamine--N-acetylmuramyl-(pentapeptide) pyrophosphoryl-undecaprenol N-acetylglucosamine transferase